MQPVLLTRTGRLVLLRYKIQQSDTASSRQTAATLCSTSRQNLTAPNGCLPRAEPVTALTHQAARLKRAFHSFSPSLLVWHAPFGAACCPCAAWQNHWLCACPNPSPKLSEVYTWVHAACQPINQAPFAAYPSVWQVDGKLAGGGLTVY